MTPDTKPIIFLATANDWVSPGGFLRNLSVEVRQVRAALDPSLRAGHCELIERPNATLAEIFDVFQDARYGRRIAFFHFAGHANSYQLLFESAEGKPAPADAAAFAAFLGHQARSSLLVAFLNGCSTHQQVEALLDAGVSAVIATSQDIADQAAADFSARIYTGLASGAALGAAFGAAHAALQSASGADSRNVRLVTAGNTPADGWPWRLYVRTGAEAVRDWSLPLAAGDPLFGLPPPPALDLPPTPFLNLGYFDRDHAGIFFGRGREIRELYQQVTGWDAAPIVLYYGQSGVGKSSLLAAGLLPRLEAQQEVRYGRRDSAAGLLATLRRLLTDDADGDLVAGWHCIEAAIDRPLLVVLDQVEEAYTRQDGRGDQELGEVLRALQPLFAAPGRRPRGRLLLSFRKEWSSDIRRLLLEQRLAYSESPLARLDRDGIVEAITGLEGSERLRRHYRLTVAADLPGVVADDLLEDAGAAVAPTLQILLTKMWEHAKAQNFDHPRFDLPLYWEMKREGLLLKDFLDQQLRSLHEAQPAAVESGLALDVLAFHTTPQSTAAQWTRDELAQEYRHQEAELPALVREFQHRYLLVDPSQHQPEKPPSTRLAHDALAPLVRERFARSVAPGQQARRILENRAVQWRDGLTGPVLDEADLAVVEAGRSGMRVWKEQHGETRLVAASRLAQQKHRRQRGLAIGAILTLAMAVILAVGWDTLNDTWLRWQVLQASRQVDMGPFRIDRYEVPVALYHKCNRADSQRCPMLVGNENFGRYSDGERELGELPITGVPAVSAQEYCQWLGRRLPTLSEWRTSALKFDADQIGPPPDRQIIYGPTINLGPDAQELWPVAEDHDQTSQETNQALHLLGNVWEWTCTSPSGPESSCWTDYGGVWYVGGGYDFQRNDLKLANLQYEYNPFEQPGESIGFRCVVDSGRS